LDKEARSLTKKSSAVCTTKEATWRREFTRHSYIYQRGRGPDGDLGKADGAPSDHLLHPNELLLSIHLQLEVAQHDQRPVVQERRYLLLIRRNLP
jgi:hypothetical protein